MATSEEEPQVGEIRVHLQDVETDALPVHRSLSMDEVLKYNPAYPKDSYDQLLQPDSLIDIVIVYAKADYEHVNNVLLPWYRSLLSRRGLTDVTIELCDSEIFPPSDICKVDDIVNRCLRILLFLTPHFPEDINLQFFVESGIYKTRLQYCEESKQLDRELTKIRKYSIRPIHTEKEKTRRSKYKTPTGVGAVHGIDYFAKDKVYVEQQAVNLAKQARCDRIRLGTLMSRALDGSDQLYEQQQEILYQREYQSVPAQHVQYISGQNLPYSQQSHTNSVNLSTKTEYESQSMTLEGKNVEYFKMPENYSSNKATNSLKDEICSQYAFATSNAAESIKRHNKRSENLVVTELEAQGVRFVPCVNESKNKMDDDEITDKGTQRDYVREIHNEGSEKGSQIRSAEETVRHKTNMLNQSDLNNQYRLGEDQLGGHSNDPGQLLLHSPVQETVINTNQSAEDYSDDRRHTGTPIPESTETETRNQRPSFHSSSSLQSSSLEQDVVTFEKEDTQAQGSEQNQTSNTAPSSSGINSKGHDYKSEYTSTGDSLRTQSHVLYHSGPAQSAACAEEPGSEPGSEPDDSTGDWKEAHKDNIGDWKEAYKDNIGDWKEAHKDNIGDWKEAYKEKSGQTIIYHKHYHYHGRRPPDLESSKDTLRTTRNIIITGCNVVQVGEKGQIQAGELDLDQRGANLKHSFEKDTDEFDPGKGRHESLDESVNSGMSESWNNFPANQEETTGKGPNFEGDGSDSDNEKISGEMDNLPSGMESISSESESDKISNVANSNDLNVSVNLNDSYQDDRSTDGVGHSEHDADTLDDEHTDEDDLLDKWLNHPTNDLGLELTSFILPDISDSKQEVEIPDSVSSAFYHSPSIRTCVVVSGTRQTLHSSPSFETFLSPQFRNQSSDHVTLEEGSDDEVD